MKGVCHVDGLKLVIVGGGSSYTPELIDGIIRHHSEFPVSRVVLVDVEPGREKVTTIEGLIGRMLKKAQLNVSVDVVFDRRKALAGADFVVTQFRVGGLEARSCDEKIPLRYGLIGQETTGAGGFAKALRTIPVARDIARDLQDLAPNAWLINFTNPSGIITEAFLRTGHSRTIGLCNVPLSMQRNAAQGLGVAPERVRLSMAGLNHLSWADHIWLDGHDVLRDVLASPAAMREVVANIPGGGADEGFLQQLGLLPSPYLKYYFYTRHVLAGQQKALEEGRGTRADEVLDVERDLFALYRNPDLNEKPPELSKRGGAWYSEAAVSVMRAIFCNRPEVHVVNTFNKGAISGLPHDTVVETDCLIDASGAVPLCHGPMPDSLAGLVQQVKGYEQFTLRAGLDGDTRAALTALALHPLVSDAPLAFALWRDIFEANRSFLPQFRSK